MQLSGASYQMLPSAAPANIPEMLELTTPVQYVKGIGPRLADVLAAKGIHTVDDLLHYLPFRYEDRRDGYRDRGSAHFGSLPNAPYAYLSDDSGPGQEPPQMHLV